jgi:hypothetical protein
MHPLINVYLAEAIQTDRLRQAEQRRRARQATRRSPSTATLRAPWPAGWSSRHFSLRSH